jgi:hypothetical protein
VTLLGAQPPEDDPARLALEASRTTDRLRTLSLVRLATALPDGRTRAQSAFLLAQQLVDRVSELTGAAPRALPPLPDRAAGDVLAVCVHDLVEVLRSGSADEPARARACRTSVAELIALRTAL